MNCVAFDLELDGDVILCAATWKYATGESAGHSRLWARQEGDTHYSSLRASDVEELVLYLQQSSAEGATLVTWGGTASDWKILHCAVSSALKPTVMKLAREHVDIPLAACATSGMMMGLSATCQGMSIGTGARSLASAAVPAFWTSRALPLQFMVLQHVAEDAFLTGSIFLALHSQAQHESPALTWITQRRRSRSIALARCQASQGFRLPTVQECTSWAAPHTEFQVPEMFKLENQAAWLA